MDEPLLTSPHKQKQLVRFVFYVGAAWWLLQHASDPRLAIIPAGALIGAAIGLIWNQEWRGALTGLILGFFRGLF